MATKRKKISLKPTRALCLLFEKGFYCLALRHGGDCAAGAHTEACNTVAKSSKAYGVLEGEFRRLLFALAEGAEEAAPEGVAGSSGVYGIYAEAVYELGAILRCDESAVSVECDYDNAYTSIEQSLGCVSWFGEVGNHGALFSTDLDEVHVGDEGAHLLGGSFGAWP